MYQDGEQPEHQPVSEPTDRCKHGVRFPHECKECADEPYGFTQTKQQENHPMKMKTMIRIDRAALHAAFRCAAKDGIRHYLNGVLVEASATETILVATDGYRLAAVRRYAENQGIAGKRPAPVLIIPRDVVEKLVKHATKKVDYEPLTLVVGEGGALSTIIDARGITATVEHRFAPIDGKFPDWRRVVPAACSGETAQFDPELLDAFSKAAKDLGYEPWLVTIAHNGATGGARISISDDDSFVGVLMPVRNAPALKAPDWVHAVAPAEREPKPTEAQIEQHPDDAAVDRFAAAMKAKLAEKRAEGRGGWDDPEQCSTTYLATLLRGHVEKGDPLDVGNFAMMLWNRGGATNEAVDPGIPDLRLTEAQIERLRAEVEALRAAIERHRLNIWGDHEVQHPEDVALYAALAAKE